MTRKIYYEDAYQQQFAASVLASKQDETGIWVALDQTAFYPTGGGQPHDTGILRFGDRDVQVTDVLKDEQDAIWHRVDVFLETGTLVQGVLHWTRRWDHMQQHGGEHILAGSIWHIFQGVTRGLHLGEEFSTIDVTMPSERVHLTEEETRQLEALANERIMSDAPIRCWFPSAEELHTLPLRKKATVFSQVRVIAAGDFEMVPCGGTHPASTGQIGMIKIMSITPSRGFMRVQFVAGMRALAYFRTCMDSAKEAGALLSASIATLPQAVQKMLEQNDAVKNELALLKQEKVQALSAQLTAAAETLPGGGSLIKALLPQTDMITLRDVAVELVKQSRTIALLAAPSANGVLAAFARSDDADEDMAQLLRRAGAKGGGRADLAQGKADGPDVLEKAATLLVE